MTSALAAAPSSVTKLEDALAIALPRIPPLWPLKHFVAVNPYLGFLNKPFAEACVTLQRTVGSAPVQHAADYKHAYQEGFITESDLEAAADEALTKSVLLQALETPSGKTETHPHATVADLLDLKHARSHWSVFIVDEISKWCAVTFDENQTTWNSPWKKIGLFSAWREAGAHDRNPESFGLTGFRAFVASVPADATAAIAYCLEVMAPHPVDLGDFLHRQLATISGWAGYVQYLVREDVMRGRENPALRELLAIRLAYDAALHQAFAHDADFLTAWENRKPASADARTFAALARWQFAFEIGYQRELAHSLAAQASTTPATRPVAQAVFCIDVRSEVFRRHLEAALPGTQTIGFAGFFGFPLSHKQAASDQPATRCPVLLVPPIESCEPLPAAESAAEASRLAEAGAWKAFQNSASSCFSFVESVGLVFGAALGRKAKSQGPSCSRVAPDFTSTDLNTRVALAAGALRNMSLVRNFAPLVLFCGHGSASANNPYASGLDCGACGGHAGDVNARLAAYTLNDPAVRSGLAEQGIVIPDDTVFLAGLHQTTSDDVALFDLDKVPLNKSAEIENLRRALSTAGATARRERAPSLGLAGAPDAKLDALVRARASDISQVRPEWGLANNTALVAAPRSRTAALKLEGRVFLHDYDASLDPEDKVLTLILCAPVVVASWINLQYYASRVDPERYGAGNKVLHNVVSGIGVLEGNGGDLKVGLPLQSIHDGEKFVHEPRRLIVYIEALRPRISAVLSAQPGVRQLFDHGWIHLVALEGGTAHRYTPDGWKML